MIYFLPAICNMSVLTATAGINRVAVSSDQDWLCYASLLMKKLHDPAWDGLPLWLAYPYGAIMTLALFFVGGVGVFEISSQYLVAFAVLACIARVFTELAAWVYPIAVFWAAYSLVVKALHLLTT